MFEVPECLIAFTNDLIQAQDEGKNSYAKIVKESFRLTMDPKAGVSINPAFTVKDKIIEITYNDILANYKQSYPEIDKTKGDITKYRYYKQIVLSIDTLRRFYNYKYPEKMATLIALHEMIIQERPNFEHGYRYDITIMKAIYTALVLTLLQLESICILEYTREIAGTRVVKRAELRTVVNARRIVKLYRDGQWSLVMAEFKKRSSHLTGGEIIFGAVVWGSVAIIALSGILAIVREMIYQFYRTSYEINDSLKVSSEFLKEAMKEDKAGSTAYKREAALNKAFIGLSDFIETKILKEDREATKALTDSNKKNYSKKQITEQPKMMQDNQAAASDDNASNSNSSSVMLY